MESLLIKLPKPPVKYNLKPAIQYYSSLAITTHFCLVETTEKQVLKIKQDIKSFKAAGVDKLLVGRLLNDGADILAKLVPVLCNLSISRRVFPSASKVGNYGLYLRAISLLPVISKIIEMVVYDQTSAFLMKIYHATTNLALEKIIQQIFVCPI